MKTIGIIGGLGPETTAEFYLELIFAAFKKNKTQRPPILIWNVPLKYDIEIDLITKATGEERYIPYLTEAAKRLEKGGADFIVMPCNSLHIFIDEIRKSVSIPVISIIEETVHFLQKKNLTKVGILATSSAIKHRLYQSQLEKSDISYTLPNKTVQKKLGPLIEKLVTSRHDEKEKKELLTIISSMDTHIEAILLACTDLQLLVPKHSKKPIYDTMKILANATVQASLDK